MPALCRNTVASGRVNVWRGPPGPCFHGLNGGFFDSFRVNLESVVPSFVCVNNGGEGSEVENNEVWFVLAADPTMGRR